MNFSPVFSNIFSFFYSDFMLSNSKKILSKSKVISKLKEKGVFGIISHNIGATQNSFRGLFNHYVKVNELFRVHTSNKYVVSNPREVGTPLPRIKFSLIHRLAAYIGLQLYESNRSASSHVPIRIYVILLTIEINGTKRFIGAVGVSINYPEVKGRYAYLNYLGIILSRRMRIGGSKIPLTIYLSLVFLSRRWVGEAPRIPQKAFK